MPHPLLILGWLFRLTFTGFCVAIVSLGVACTAGWLPIGQKPSFFELDGPRPLNCYGERDSDPPNPFTVEFLDQGYTAVIRFGQAQARLTFDPGHVWSVWKNDEVELMMDPEIYISGLGGHQIGPCERICLTANLGYATLSNMPPSGPFS
ncbi:hypothetical protein [Microvirga sp. TS319]|uniref:hypothetical protein n=1 Tax=Microvirga sp. TS319 TaxID=3241165 RepID=UPI00351A0445